MCWAAVRVMRCAQSRSCSAPSSLSLGALLHTAAVPYARLLHEHLAAAGITVNGPGTRPVQERALARAVLELLDLAEHDVPRGDLFRVLAAAPVRTSQGALVPVSRWERLSRTAGVVAGQHWDTRLSRLPGMVASMPPEANASAPESRRARTASACIRAT